MDSYYHIPLLATMRGPSMANLLFPSVCSKRPHLLHRPVSDSEMDLESQYIFNFCECCKVSYIYRQRSFSDIVPCTPDVVLPALVKCRCSGHRCKGEWHSCESPAPSLAHLNTRRITMPTVLKEEVYSAMPEMMKTVVKLL